MGRRGGAEAPRRALSEPGAREPLTTGELEARYPQLTHPPVPPREHLPHLDLQLERILLRCLAPDPAERFQTVSGLLAALAPHAQGPPPPLARGRAHRAAVGHGVEMS